MPILLSIPGHAPFALDPGGTPVTIGRSEGNTLSIDDPSLSRNHGRFDSDGQDCFFEDLGSRNGSKLNGEPVTSRRPIRIGDVLELGRLKVRIEAEAAAAPAPTQLFPLEEVRMAFSALESQGGKSLDEALTLLHEISLDLLHDAPLKEQIEKILERLHGVLKPRRLVALTRAGNGDLVPLASFPASKEAIPVSRTAVAEICQSRQAMLVRDRLLDARVKDATSLIFNAVLSLMAAPLECEGAIEGLLYAEAGMGREPFGKRDLALLATVAHILAARIRTSRLLQEREKSRLIEREMELARQIQKNLLPAADPVTSRFEFLGRAIPSRQVGGDLYGYWQPADNRLFGAIADVSGKGVGPGLLMACLVAYMNGSTRSNPETATLATWLSRDLAGHTTSNRFATAFLFSLDLDGDAVEYTNAGHNPGLLVGASGEILQLESQGLPLALFPGTVPYGQARVPMGPGDLLFLYTDGITEAANAEGEEFGSERLEALLRQCRGLPLRELLQQLDRTMDAFTAGTPHGDDRTVLVVRRI
jgi:sigma-B regulation protein RsbU (phosphoserine phosphatase)